MRHHWCVRIALLALAFAALVNTSIAAEHSDLGGRWKLNVTKSDFSYLSGLQSKVLKIEHSDHKLRVRSTVVDQLGEHSESYNFTTDGKANENDMDGIP